MRTTAPTREEQELDRTGLPARYRDRTWDSVLVLGETSEQRRNNQEQLERVHEFRAALASHLKRGQGAYLGGPLGTGKTLLMTLLLRDALAVCRTANREQVRGGVGPSNSVRFLLASRLPDLLYPPRDPEAPEHALRRELTTAAVLGLDDLTKLPESARGGEVAFLDRVIRERYHAGLPTFYTAQVPLTDRGTLPGLGSTLKSRGIEDLLVETCETFFLVAASARRSPRAKN